MGTRLELHTLLKGVIEAINVSGKVYFQPPASMLMAYPCIVYERSGIDVNYAGNHPYKHTNKYLVTVIDSNPDSTIPDAISKLPMTDHSRGYVVENLNHHAFVLFF